MNQAFTVARTRTLADTYTDARLWAVMPEVGADFYALAAAGLISSDTAQKWTEELAFILQHRAAHGFQIQLRCTGRNTIALDYRVSSDGSIQESSTAGGINYFGLPAGTHAFLFVELNFSASNIAKVQDYIRERGWGTGQAVQGDAVRDRVYSKEGYGVIRSKIGTWP